MDVIPVMNPIILTNKFFRQSNGHGKPIFLILTLLVQIMLFILSGCQTPTSNTYIDLGHGIDISENIYHRLKAGLFEIRKDPVILRVMKKPTLKTKIFHPRDLETAPHKMVRISWELGSFFVKSDDRALVVIYLNKEAAFSHIQVTPLKGFNLNQHFRESVQHPIR